MTKMVMSRHLCRLSNDSKATLQGRKLLDTFLCMESIRLDKEKAEKGESGLHHYHPPPLSRMSTTQAVGFTQLLILSRNSSRPARRTACLSERERKKERKKKS